MDISPIPRTYSGVNFRSTLEADWAAILDSLKIIWQYEPEAVKLPSGELYLPDFYLPEIATWLEVKGPHNERIGKTHELANAVYCCPGCSACLNPPIEDASWEDCASDEEWRGRASEFLDIPNWCDLFAHQLVVVGRASVSGVLTWDDKDIELRCCRKCDKWYWLDITGPYGCRACSRGNWGGSELGWPRIVSGSRDEGLAFVRAPRRLAVTRELAGYASPVKLRDFGLVSTQFLVLSTPDSYNFASYSA